MEQRIISLFDLGVYRVHIHRSFPGMEGFWAVDLFVSEHGQKALGCGEVLPIIGNCGEGPEKLLEEAYEWLTSDELPQAWRKRDKEPET